VEVAGSNPAAPTIKINSLETIFQIMAPLRHQETGNCVLPDVAAAVKAMAKRGAAQKVALNGSLNI
jgi:hypothetical protein